MAQDIREASSAVDNGARKDAANPRPGQQERGDALIRQAGCRMIALERILMEGQPLSASGSEAAQFDLPTAGSRGRGIGITAEPEAIAWTSDGAVHRRAFIEIVGIQLYFDPGGDSPAAGCVIRFVDDEQLKVIVPHEPERSREIDSYIQFVPAFFRALGPANTSRIEFIFGATEITRIIELVGYGAAMATSIAILLASIAKRDDSADSRGLVFPVLMIVILVTIALVRFTAKRAPIRFDPPNVPEGLLPTPIAPPKERKKRTSLEQSG